MSELPKNSVFRVNSSGQELQRAETALKQQFLYFLKKSLGNVADALLNLAIERIDYLRWLEEDIDFRYAVACIMEDVGDAVEAQLMKKIEGGDTYAIVFYCKTKLKHRGYAEKKESEGGDKPSKTTVNVSVILPKTANTDNIQEAIVVDGK
jgi:hypothetical protein